MDDSDAAASSTDDPRTDEALMLAYRDGDGPAFEALYGRWRGRLYRYLAHQAAQAADELFQDVWLRVVGARAHYEVTAKFSTWLFRIAHNRLVDHHRARGRSILELAGDGAAGLDEDPDYDPVDSMAAPEQESPQAMLERREAARHILDCLAALPLPQRDAFLMAEEGGMSLEQIANATGVGRETAKSRLRYALDRLRRCLAALIGT
ncbi:MAG: sigma-70 family RNA polymerase sigma factor [Thiobacillus sp.]|nr:sigma-70 family RNA polymerase sigma factor [Thiobacillus sp.]